MIIIYSKPDCIQCEYTKRKLVERGLMFTELDITTDDDARKMVADSGILALPMVDIVNRGNLVDRWHGFKLDKIRGIRK